MQRWVDLGRSFDTDAQGWKAPKNTDKKKEGGK